MLPVEGRKGNTDWEIRVCLLQSGQASGFIAFLMQKIGRLIVCHRGQVKDSNVNASSSQPADSPFSQFHIGFER